MQSTAPVSDVKPAGWSDMLRLNAVEASGNAEGGDFRRKVVDFHLSAAPFTQLSGEFFRRGGKFLFRIFRQHVQIDGRTGGGGPELFQHQARQNTSRLPESI